MDEGMGRAGAGGGEQEGGASLSKSVEGAVSMPMASEGTGGAKASGHVAVSRMGAADR